MPRDRVPQNSASSTHRRLFSDLQAVYEKIIQTNGSSFPFRAKDSRRFVHTAPAGLGSRKSLGVANCVYKARAPSACSSVEEIVIKPLHFHNRLTCLPGEDANRNPCFSSVSSTSDNNFNRHSQSEYSRNGSRLMRARSKSSLSTASAPVEYSEQSIRYVMEQVSLEQARQLKLRSNVKQHRVDRRYFVSGSKVQPQNQAFEELAGEVLQLNSGKTSKTKNNGRLCRRFRPSTSNRGDATMSAKGGRGEEICSLSASCLSISATSREVVEADVAAVAIPTATDSKHVSTHGTENITVDPFPMTVPSIVLDSPA